MAIGAGAASAEERLALVIGNGQYAQVAKLKNPIADARAITEMLRKARFTVTAVEEAGGAGLAEAVATFGRAVEKAGPDTVAMIYYAGHAAQLDGHNYLLPVDLRVKDESDVKTQSVSVDALLKMLDATPARSRVVILDACRNNPFPSSGEAGPRGLTASGPVTEARGEGGVTRLNARIGTLVAFATAPGQVAADGAAGHSPYTDALLKLMPEPGLPLEALFRRARLAVHETTGGIQTPWESSSLTGDFSFFPGPAREIAEAPLPVAAQAAARTGVTRERLRELGPADAYALTVYLGTVAVQTMYVEVFPREPRALAFHVNLASTAEEIAWSWAIREGSAQALVRFLALHPASRHRAEVERLLPLTPRADRVTTTAAICPPAAPLPRAVPALPRRAEPKPAPQPKKAQPEPAPKAVAARPDPRPEPRPALRPRRPSERVAIEEEEVDLPPRRPAPIVLSYPVGRPGRFPDYGPRPPRGHADGPVYDTPRPGLILRPTRYPVDVGYGRGERPMGGMRPYPIPSRPTGGYGPSPQRGFGGFGGMGGSFGGSMGGRMGGRSMF